MVPTRHTTEPVRVAIHAATGLVVLASCTSQPRVAPAGRSAAAPAAQPLPPSIAGTRPAATPLSDIDRAPHELVVQMLLDDDSAVPERPTIHPVRTLYNREAVVPPMCYTKTDGTHNPCYVCHQDAQPGRPNRMDDGDLQLGYSFSELGQTNHYRNLFRSRTSEVAKISDEEILEWVRGDNYSELASRLEEQGFRGYVPDLENLNQGKNAFDDEGFAKDGSHWVAFNYKPLPSTFWPTNGSTDDVMIRLPEVYRTLPDGSYSRDVYRANLALVEANVKGAAEMSVAGLDERTLGADLDGDGKLGTASVISNMKAYVGAAKDHIKIPGLFPLDTEFLHSVRYLDVGDHGAVVTSQRMKELRYMKKRFFKSHDALAEEYRKEGYDKDAGYLPGYVNRGDHGLDNEMGWVLLGFIENKSGRLRVNSFEENMYCMGCHTSIGSTIDSTFSFARKIDGERGWGYVDLRGMPDAPNRGESRGEIATYLDRAGGGGEFRSNPEMEERWFSGGQADPQKIGRARDVYDLITPSGQRALALNKAYRVLVAEQSFIYGRDATIAAPENVYERIDNETTPTLPEDRSYRWDIRLDWEAAFEATAQR